MTRTQHEIRTRRLLLRALREEDLDAFAEMNADPQVMRYFPATLSRDETIDAVARIRAVVEEHGFGMWAVEIPARAPFIGIVGLTRPSFTASFTPCVEVGWRLSAQHWGQGYATEAALASVRFGFERLGLDEILAWTTPDNGASRRVMEKIGMTRDAAGDFDHPRITVGHPRGRHVLYRLPRLEFQRRLALP